MVGVLVLCPLCKRLHRYPWRWNWGSGLDVVSFQKSRCAGRFTKTPVWIALDPSADSDNTFVHQAAHDDYEAWAAKRTVAKLADAKPE